jgi:hypothetical protein
MPAAARVRKALDLSPEEDLSYRRECNFRPVIFATWSHPWLLEGLARPPIIGIARAAVLAVVRAVSLAKFNPSTMRTDMISSIWLVRFAPIGGIAGPIYYNVLWEARLPNCSSENEETERQHYDPSVHSEGAG